MNVVMISRACDLTSFVQDCSTECKHSSVFKVLSIIVPTLKIGFNFIYVRSETAHPSKVQVFHATQTLMTMIMHFE